MTRYYPSFEEFKKLAQPGRTIPVYRQLLSDALTPVSAYLRISEAAEHAFLLESVVGGERIARYSFLGAEPVAVFQAHGKKVEITRADQTQSSESEDPLKNLEELLASYQGVHLPGLPRFTGGAVGYASYDVVRYYEGESLPKPPQDDRQLPDLLFGLYDSMVIFDHVYKTIKVLGNAHIGTEGAKTAYDRACKSVEVMVEKLKGSADMSLKEIGNEPSEGLEYESNFTKEEYMAVVESCKEYIRAGDIFQVVPSQRLTVELRAEPFDVYRALRTVNPSPFMFLLKSPECVLIGSSPEIMCQVEDGVVTNRPLAGTRRRGKTEQEDKALETELLADPKERAEHVMLVDLGRNDVGRVAQAGTVELSDLMSIERYSHVMHICSNVTGKLAAGKTAFDALRATLPVGTVTGAPKVRAMQIIDEFEPTRRGPYAGAVGYIDYAGNMGTCITLRTIVAHNGKAHVQAGGGVVADSVPEAEYEETLNKARALLRAI
ncbi:MAG: anthranilate synthase component I, partial [Actinobacteria bacterium]|nr:anthranilate synthase component I [Actinomycetota bacterium]